MSKLRSTLLASLLVLSGGLTNERAAFAQDAHGVVDVDTSCLMGGVVKGRWLEDAAIKAMLKGGERYRLYTLKGAAGEATGGKPESAGEPCTDTQSIEFSPKPEHGIAVGGQWNAMPRVPQVLSTTDAAYRQVVAGILRAKGFTNLTINITGAWRVDLEGDGVDEVLVSATHLAGGLGGEDRGMAFRAEKGDYSFVLLRKVVRGRVRNIMLLEEYYPRKVDYGVPNQYTVAGVLDLNGDGKMEIICHMDYYEGSSSTAFRVDGSKITNVFGCGCGA